MSESRGQGGTSEQVGSEMQANKCFNCFLFIMHSCSLRHVLSVFPPTPLTRASIPPTTAYPHLSGSQSSSRPGRHRPRTGPQGRGPPPCPAWVLPGLGMA